MLIHPNGVQVTTGEQSTGAAGWEKRQGLPPNANLTGPPLGLLCWGQACLSSLQLQTMVEAGLSNPRNLISPGSDLSAPDSMSLQWKRKLTEPLRGTSANPPF